MISLRRILSPFSRLIKKDVMLFCARHHGSGSNVVALYSDLADDSSIGLHCHLICSRNKGSKLKGRIRLEILMMRAKWIVQDHGGRAPYPNQKVIELWHGIPLKTMDSMDTSQQTPTDPVAMAQSLPDIVLSTSRMYETLLSACRGIPGSHYRRFGFPRLRWLKTERSLARQQLAEVIGSSISDDQRVVLWMPTHRKVKSNGTGNGRSVIPSLLQTYLNDGLKKSLQNNNCILVLKPHPNDEALARRHVDRLGSNVQLLTSDAFRSVVEDLYCLLPATDALITDYSSVYFDYLLLDKPIGFVVDDLEEYRRERGFLLEPVTDWMPGTRINTHATLLNFLEQLNAGQDHFMDERNTLRSTFFPDGIADSAKLIRQHLLESNLK